MKPNRNYITPFISLVFLFVGMTGLLMLFHLFDGYTEVVHEILGLFFTVCAIFHIMLNWKALKMHFTKGVFLPALLAILSIAAILVVAERIYLPVDLQIMEKIVKAPVEDVLNIFNISYEEASEKLRKRGILLEKAKRFEDLWIHNDAEPEEIIDLLLESGQHPLIHKRHEAF